MMKKFVTALKFQVFDAEICPQCGSSNIEKRGFEGENLRSKQQKAPLFGDECVMNYAVNLQTQA
jgi:hypothetical protein